MSDDMWVKFWEFGVCRIFKEEEKELFNTIPHGSGIDGTWQIRKMKSYFKCDCDYHAMNGGGYYDGWAEFSVIIPFKDPENFKLHFHGNHSQQLNSKHCLRECLEQTMSYWIGEWSEVKKTKLIAVELARADQDFGRKEI